MSKFQVVPLWGSQIRKLFDDNIILARMLELSYLFTKKYIKQYENLVGKIFIFEVIIYF